ncbi:Uncharacterised protein [Streptococcus pseudoporcinus]|nr:Uncharacterised protein [Streptococcus pseudoporcinus]
MTNNQLATQQAKRDMPLIQAFGHHKTSKGF